MRTVIPLAAYVVGEGLLAELLASRFGWPAVLGLFALGLVTGVLAIIEAGRRASRSVRAASDPSRIPPPARPGRSPNADSPATNLGDAGLMFIGGVLLAVPGVATDVLGLLLLLPLTRRWCRRPVSALLGSRLRKFTVTLVSPARPPGQSKNPGAQGDVITGEVIDRRDEPPGPRLG